MQSKPISENMGDELGKADKPDRMSGQEDKGAQYELQDEKDRIILLHMDEYLNKSENDIGDKPIEQADSKE